MWDDSLEISFTDNRIDEISFMDPFQHQVTSKKDKDKVHRGFTKTATVCSLY